jgi:transposase
MTRRQKDPLRPLTQEEREVLGQIARMRSQRADRVARAKALLAVADGASFTEAAIAAGRKAGDAVAHLVARFNREGLAAVDPRHGGGPPRKYDTQIQERILRELQRTPEREQDGTATWSLTTLQRALRRAPDGLAAVSTWSILHTLWEAGYTWQQDRTWCQTGTVLRKGKKGPVQVTDPNAIPKKS